MLIHHGEMVAIILHKFVAMTEVSKHVQTLGSFFQHNGIYFWEIRMSLFGHKVYRKDFIVDRLIPLNNPNLHIDVPLEF